MPLFVPEAALVEAAAPLFPVVPTRPIHQPWVAAPSTRRPGRLPPKPTIGAGASRRSGLVRAA
jgi:hypothetical protein